MRQFRIKHAACHFCSHILILEKALKCQSFETIFCLALCADVVKLMRVRESQSFVYCSAYPDCPSCSFPNSHCLHFLPLYTLPHVVDHTLLTLQGACMPTNVDPTETMYTCSARLYYRLSLLIHTEVFWFGLNLIQV